MLEEDFIGWGSRGSDQLVDRYWSEVESLLKGWGCEEADAHNEVLKLRERLRALPAPAANVMIYHHEPFTLAYELRGAQLTDEQRYAQVEDKAGYAEVAGRAGIELERED